MNSLESKEESFYEDLFHKWRRESSSKQLNPLSRDYYQRIGEYIGRRERLLQELDDKSTRAVLLKEELDQTLKIARNLIATRRRKILRITIKGEMVPAEGLTVEDEGLYRSILSGIEDFNKKILQSFEGKIEDGNSEGKQITPKRILVRFLREIPAIIGSDMRTYGPFKTEDIATLPKENATALIRQEFAIEVKVPKDEGP